jgi:hypothetical protein
VTPSVAVSELPILFSGPMVRAILDGVKSQTRRVVRPQPEFGVHPCHFVKSGWAHETRPNEYGASGCTCRQIPYSYGWPGDLLYVRETFCPTHVGVVFRADYPASAIAIGADKYPPEAEVYWLPSIHMPKVAARLWLRVTEMRVQRIQEITEADAIAEGMTKRGEWWDAGPNWEGDGIAENAVDAYAALWDSLNADRGYEFARNPWVWVVSFERTEAPL